MLLSGQILPKHHIFAAKKNEEITIYDHRRSREDVATIFFHIFSWYCSAYYL